MKSSKRSREIPASFLWLNFLFHSRDAVGMDEVNQYAAGDTRSFRFKQG